MKKILIISQLKSLRGAHKAAVELEKVLKLRPKNRVSFFSEDKSIKNKISFLKIKIFKIINKFIKPFFGKKNTRTPV